MTIEIIEAEFTIDEGGDFWRVWLEITQAPDSYLLPTTADGAIVEGQLQAHFDALEGRLWSIAQAKAISPDAVYEHLELRIIKALALVTLDEINILRSQEGLPERTPEQLRTAIKNRLSV